MTEQLTPREQIKHTLTGRRAVEVGQLVGLLVVMDYEWPSPEGRRYTRPTWQRVYATLRALEEDGEVERVPALLPTRWRLKR